MRFMICQDDGGQFHWRLGDDAVKLAVSTAFGSRQDARRAAADMQLRAGSATGRKLIPQRAGRY
jgi:uncharacterized protein YegP (UPF0339 family)